jgi:Methyltransferase domain
VGVPATLPSMDPSSDAMEERDPPKAIWTFQGFDPSSYDEVLPVSMAPRGGNEVIDELVSAVPLDTNSVIVDAACYDASASLPLSNRVGCRLIGVDISRHGLDARRAQVAEFANGGMLSFVLGRMEAIPLADGIADLTWCRDAMSCAPVSVASLELARVTKSGGSVMLHTTCATGRLCHQERAWLFRVLGLSEESMDRVAIEEACTAAGLTLAGHERVGNQSLQERLERPDAGPSELLTVARLTEYPGHYIARWGELWYQRVLAWESWALYHSLGKLEDHVWLFTKKTR